MRRPAEAGGASAASGRAPWRPGGGKRQLSQSSESSGRRGSPGAGLQAAGPSGPRGRGQAERAAGWCSPDVSLAAGLPPGATTSFVLLPVLLCSRAAYFPRPGRRCDLRRRPLREPDSQQPGKASSLDRVGDGAEAGPGEGLPLPLPRPHPRATGPPPVLETAAVKPESGRRLRAGRARGGAGGCMGAGLGLHGRKKVQGS